MASSRDGPEGMGVGSVQVNPVEGVEHSIDHKSENLCAVTDVHSGLSRQRALVRP